MYAAVTLTEHIFFNVTCVYLPPTLQLSSNRLSRLQSFEFAYYLCLAYGPVYPEQFAELGKDVGPIAGSIQNV